ncbi:hypothetical protein ABZ897_54315 [Nonomuraea sp. NPDC046802]|uniref:hypothetical protein n=1 Tax=Nonomuraea sp. NPDC046802 TaxID=3154919 RepID=UPI0033FC3AF2
MTSAELPRHHVPADLPDERPTALDRLDVLVGQWEGAAIFEAGFLGPGSPEVIGRSRTTFE